jgi:2-oxoglutarate ferredoxin oxidoreductase subunit alpha
VILLSDGFIANGAEPWRLPRVEDLPAFPVAFRTEAEGFLPYLRNPRTLARPWALPGTPGLEHRIGGLEKSDGTGNVSYEPHNHERMVRLRAEKVERVADDLPDCAPAGDPAGGLLVVGWGSTYGAITSAVRRARDGQRRVSHLHLRHLNPFPRNLGEVLARYDRILVPEINLGQLAFLLQGRFCTPVERQNKVQGLPFTAAEIHERIVELT